MAAETKTEDISQVALERVREIARVCAEEVRASIAQITEKASANLGELMLEQFTKAIQGAVQFPTRSTHGYSFDGIDESALLSEEFVVHICGYEHISGCMFDNIGEYAIITNFGRVGELSLGNDTGKGFRLDSNDRIAKYYSLGTVHDLRPKPRLRFPGTSDPVTFLTDVDCAFLRKKCKDARAAETVVSALIFGRDRDAWRVSQETQKSLKALDKQTAELRTQREALKSERAALAKEREAIVAEWKKLSSGGASSSRRGLPEN